MPEIVAQVYPWGSAKAGLLESLTSIDLPEHLHSINELIGKAVMDSIKLAVDAGHGPPEEAPFCVIVNFR